MTTLTEIEAAAEALSPAQKQELILFLAAKLRADRTALPAPRSFSAQEVADWIAEDEADGQRLNESR